MRRTHSRTAALAVAVAAGGLAAFALRPATGTSTATLAARNPAVEVRTQVIRRTIHVIRHEPAAPLRGARVPAALLVGGHGHARTASSGAHRSTPSAATAAVATRASGVHGGGSAAPSATGVPVSTRASGSHSSSAAMGTTHPVSTRTSGSHSSGSSTAASHPVSTRASGSHSGAASGSPSRPVTRSSGGGHHGGDGGDGRDGGGDGGGDN